MAEISKNKHNSFLFAKGGNLFAKHILSVDHQLQAGEEFLAVDRQDRLPSTDADDGYPQFFP